MDEKRKVFKVSVEGLIYNNKNEVLLMKRSPSIAYGNMYCLPGGHLENNETIVEGMIRELKEEIGVVFNENELELVKVINRTIKDDNYIDFIFKGYLKDRRVFNLEKEKCTRIIYRKIDKMPDNAIPVLKMAAQNNNMYISMEE